MDEPKMKIFYTEQNIYEKGKVTIEDQLHLYEKHPSGSERNAVLWHAWQQNKRWLIQLLELTIASFPAYSRHNASHAKAVLYNIERILGEERIKRLEPTDCFALLHVVYVHDIGMAILANDREKMVSSDEFAEMVDELTQDSDYDLKKAALELQRICYKPDRENELPDRGGEEYLSEQKIIYQGKFNAYYAIIQLMSEFQRGKHGERAGSRINTWITDQDKLRSEFAMSGIPMRIFLRIADCASLHTEWDFQHILDLPFEENGYEHDMLHPRFIAVLLQLGDALDIDNDRFHPFAQAFLGKLPMQSQAHYDKHMAIRTLKITPEEIRVEADCISREAMRLVRNECDVLEKLLESSSYHWSSIAPRELGGALPTLQTPRLLLKGSEIPTDLAMMRFRISQRKAFSLLQGENIYSGRFPFVRELLQNAIDSTKIQCWSDYISSSKFRYKKAQEEHALPSILKVAQIVNPIEYPIEIEIGCGKQNDENEWTEVEFESIKSKDGKNEEYGILFKIRDYGTGISTEVLRDLAEVGTSYKKRKKKIRNIPEWLRPTGEFGIGLQSVFLVSDIFSCDTYTRSGERYRIEFRTGANGEHGYINVEPKDTETDKIPFGTEFRVFVSHKKKKERDEFIEAWQGHDPFSTNYENDMIKRDIVELTSQLLLDIDRQLGEILFPIYVHVSFPFDGFYKAKLDRKIHKIALDTSPDYQEHTENKLRERVSWIYNFNMERGDNFQTFKMSNGICAFDFTGMKLYMWLENISTCARLGVERILGDALEERKLCQVYFKGILAEETAITGDAELLELIDIKGGKMENNFLQLNRNGFTRRGDEHIKKVIVPEILKSAREALGIIAEKTRGDSRGGMDREKNGGSMQGRFEDVAGKYLSEALLAELSGQKRPGHDWRKQLLGISLFYHFYMMYSEKNHRDYISRKVLDERKRWKEALRRVEEIMEGSYQRIVGSGKRDIVMDMRVPLLKIGKTGKFSLDDIKNISVADFFDHERNFLLISKRRERGAEWRNYLVEFIEGNDVCDNIRRDIRRHIESQERDVRKINCGVKEMIQFRSTVEDEIAVKKTWLETWGRHVIEYAEGIIAEGCSIEQSDFLQKMLKYVPIIGCFSDADGNLRIHVMNGTFCEYIFYDNNSKFMYMKKMEERHRELNAERFMLFPYCEFEALGIREYPKDACSVHDRYVFDIEYRMLFPCSGTALEKLFSEYNEIKVGDELRAIGEELRRICNFQYEYYEEKYKELRDKFEKKRLEYSKWKKKPCSREQFIGELKMGFGLLIDHLVTQNMDASKMFGTEAEDIRFLTVIEEIETKEVAETSETEAYATEEMSEAQEHEGTAEEEQYAEEAAETGEHAERTAGAGKEEKAEMEGPVIKQGGGLPDYETIQENSKKICEEVLENYKYVVLGGREGNPLQSRKCRTYLNRLIQYVLLWNRNYDKELEQRVKECVENTRKDYWDGTKEKELLIDWNVRYSSYGRDIISEMYERLWQDIEDTMQNAWRTNEEILEGWEILSIIREGSNEE